MTTRKRVLVIAATTGVGAVASGVLWFIVGSLLFPAPGGNLGGAVIFAVLWFVLMFGYFWWWTGRQAGHE